MSAERHLRLVRPVRQAAGFPWRIPSCDGRTVRPALSWSPSLALLLLACGSAAPPADGAASPGGDRHGPAEGQFQGDGARLYYRRVGEGPDVLVMIHGGPGMD